MEEHTRKKRRQIKRGRRPLLAAIASLPTLMGALVAASIADSIKIGQGTLWQLFRPLSDQIYGCPRGHPLEGELGGGVRVWEGEGR